MTGLEKSDYDAMRPSFPALLFIILSTKLSAQVTPACDNFFDDRQVRFVVAASAGGGWDRSTRALADQFQLESGARTHVLNITGGSGYLAMKTVRDGTDQLLTIGVHSRESVLNPLQAPHLFSIDAFNVLGILSIDNEIWLSHQDIDFRSNSDERLVAFATNEYDSALRLGLIADILGRPLSAVIGFRSSNEAIAALMRREIDISSFSVGGAQRAMASNPLLPFLALTNSPLPEFPDTPYLAGPGGEVDRLSKNLEGTAREQQMQMAEDLVQIIQPLRSIVVSANVSGQTLACLQSTMNRTLFSNDLRDNMIRMRLVITPSGSNDAQQRLEEDLLIIDKYRSRLVAALEAVSQ